MLGYNTSLTLKKGVNERREQPVGLKEFLASGESQPLGLENGTIVKAACCSSKGPKSDS